MATTQIGIRLSQKEKSELEKNAQAIGLTAQSAIKVMISQFNHDKGFKYPITRKASLDEVKELPEEVEKAMLIAKAEEYGLIKDTSEDVTSVADLRKRKYHLVK